VIPRNRIAQLHRQADAARWQVSVDQFAAVLQAGVTQAFAGREPGRGDLDRHLASLHLADLALACACAGGHEGAWEHFVREQRPVLYRAADAIDPSGGARDLADAIYADLFSKSLFRYFHGRSSLSTWLRAVLAQRHVDRLRAGRRTDPLPEDESPAALAAPSPPPDPDREARLTRIQRALAAAISRLAPNDRLRMCCYYAQDLTLAQTGKLLAEHEATVSRQLARTRREIRAEVERILKGEGLTEAAIAECFAAVAEDAGPLDLGALLGQFDGSKESGLDRSKRT
jgi:RNA polymerase sigma-70 factor (ECF subfamily)